MLRMSVFGTTQTCKTPVRRHRPESIHRRNHNLMKVGTTVPYFYPLRPSVLSPPFPPPFLSRFEMKLYR